MMKQKTIRFSYQFTPIKASEKEVQELCNSPKWKVTVVAADKD